MSGSYAANNNQQWAQYSQPRLQLEHDYDFSALPQSQQGFAESYQFNPDTFQSRQFTASPPSQPANLQGAQSNSRSSSYSRTGHSPSASLDSSQVHRVYGSPQSQAQNFPAFNNSFLSADQRQYHNNAATYDFQAAITPTPRTATNLSAINTANAITPAPYRSTSPGPINPSSNAPQYYLPKPASTSQQPKVKRQRVPEPANDSKDDEMEGDMEEEGGARAKPPGACARCKNLKVKCEFKTETDPCKRCFNGGHDCVTPGRKKRRTPPKREHLLNQIREQAAEIQKLMTQLEQQSTTAGRLRPPNSAVTDSFPLTPSSGLHSPVLSPSSTHASFFGNDPSNNTSTEANKAVEDWIAKARESMADFEEFIGIGGGMPKSYLVEEDLEKIDSGDEVGSSDEPGSNPEYEIEVLDSDGEEVPQQRGRGPKMRQLSTASSNGTTGSMRAPKKKDSSGSAKLVTIPNEAVPFGLMADLSLKKSRAESPVGEEQNLGVANDNFFRASPNTPDPMRSRPLGTAPAAPHILTRGLITIQEAEKLFAIYFDRMNISVSLLDPVIYTPQRTCYRSPFLFTVVCAIASRFYTERPDLYPQAMHFAQLAAGTALISGHKCVELCQGYILMSLYPVPARRWEEERGWLYLGLAIRMAIDLNLHLPNTAKPTNENHAREMLNRTRVWLNCFNLDRSTGSQYGKAPVISNSDYTANHSEDWWHSSMYNLPNFDIHICAYNAELKVMAAFMAKIYSDPSHPTGLNKNVNFEQVASDTDEEIKRLEDKWRLVLDKTDMKDPQNRFRTGLLKLAFSYARLVALSFGFQHAHGKENNENPFLFRCLAAATDVVTAIVEDVGRQDQRIYLRHGPIAQSVFVTFAASMLVKLLQPKFSAYLDDEKRQEIRGLVKKVIDLLGSPDVSIDDKHGPNLYARFLKGLLAAPLAKAEPRQRRPPRSNSGQQAVDSEGSTPSSHMSPETTHSLSPPPNTTALSFDRFAPSVGTGVDPFMPLSFGLSAEGSANALGIDPDPSASSLYPSAISFDHLMESWQDNIDMTPGYNWLQFQQPEFSSMKTEGMYDSPY